MWAEERRFALFPWTDSGTFLRGLMSKDTQKAAVKHIYISKHEVKHVPFGRWFLFTKRFSLGGRVGINISEFKD